VDGSRTLYYPYGEQRWSASGGTLATDFTFTGQRAESFGLMDYHARFYDPYINRWIQPDTIIPDPANPQSLNRFSYVLGNPVKFRDPSGHIPEPPKEPPLPYDVTAFELGWLWLTEQCPEYMVFNENYELTQSLMHDEGANRARARFYQRLREGTLENGTDDTYGYKYLVIPYVREAVQYATGDDRIGFYLGSYTVRTHLNDEATVTFTIEDAKNLESGTRSPFYYAPDAIQSIGQRFDSSFRFPRSEHSLEELVTGNEQFVPSDIFLASVLRLRSRTDPGLFGGDIRVGGSIRQVFTWTEPLQVSKEE